MAHWMPPQGLQSRGDSSLGDDDPNTLHLYDFMANIGEGSFGRVSKNGHKENRQLYAVKVVDIFLQKRRRRDFVIKRERRAGRALQGCRYIIQMYSSFTSPCGRFCYFVMEYAENGQMKTLISQLNGLRTEVSRFYAAQLVLALEFLRQNQWVHRDMKTSNILLDKNNHVKLCDFGLAKKVGDPNTGRKGDPTLSTKVGTVDIMAPEVINQEPTSCVSDLWSLGVVIHEFDSNGYCWGSSDDRKFHIEYYIKEGKYNPLSDSSDTKLKDLVAKLLVVKSNDRVGAGNIDDLKAHPFFKPIKWETLHTQPVPSFDGTPTDPKSRPLLPPTPPPPEYKPHTQLGEPEVIMTSDGQVMSDMSSSFSRLRF